MKSSDALLVFLGVAYLSLLIITVENRITVDALASVSNAVSYPTGIARAEKLEWLPANVNAPWQKRDSQFTYIWNDELYIGGGLDATGTFTPFKSEPVYEQATYFNDLWKTRDGVNWTIVASSSSLPKIRSASVVEFANALYLYNGWGPEIGVNEYIYKSTDGVNWTRLNGKVDFTPREGQRMFAVKNKIYMFGGVSYFSRKSFNDVWVSSDGVHFEELTSSSPWSGRWDHDVTYYKDKFWLAGGMNLNMDSFNDVWSSIDGKNWNLETQTSSFEPRQGHVLLAYKDIMYLIGGLNADTNEGIGDTWFTKNGKDWFKTLQDGIWTGREDHQAVLFNGRMILFGGMDANWEWMNDVWISNFNFGTNN